MLPDRNERWVLAGALAGLILSMLALTALLVGVLLWEKPVEAVARWWAQGEPRLETLEANHIWSRRSFL